MVYTINVADVNNRELENAPMNLVATVTVEFDNILKISGISIKERKNGVLYVEMPWLANVSARSIINAKSKYFVTPGNTDFAKELYSNIIKTYVMGDMEYHSSVDEPEQTHYKINAYPSDGSNCEGFINLEIEDSIKIRGLKLIKENGKYLIDCPVNANDYLNWKLPPVHFLDDDFLNHVVKNAVSMIDDIRKDGYSQDDKDTIKVLEKNIDKEESNIQICDRMSNHICEKLKNCDDLLEAGVDDTERKEIEDKMEYLYNHLGQFAYAYFVTNNNLDMFKQQLEETKKDIETKIKSTNTKKKVSGAR